MPIIENIDGSFDLRQAKDGECVRLQDGRVLNLKVEKVDPSERFLQHPKFNEIRNDYYRVRITTACQCCGQPFTFSKGKHRNDVRLAKNCPKHEGLRKNTYEKLRINGKLNVVEKEIKRRKHKKHDIVIPEKPEKGFMVVFRNLHYVILNVRDYVSARTGNESVILDLAGFCVVCGKEFPCAVSLSDKRPLPLRCKSCQDAAPIYWRYNPQIHNEGRKVGLLSASEPHLSYYDPFTGETFTSLEQYNKAKGRV